MGYANSIAWAPLAGLVVLAVVVVFILQTVGGGLAFAPAATPLHNAPLQTAGSSTGSTTPTQAARAVTPMVAATPSPTEGASPSPARVKEPGPTPAATVAESVSGNPPGEPVTISVTNQACLIQEYRVDGEAKLTLAPGETKAWVSQAGEHAVQVCFPGTGDCTEQATLNWTLPLSITIDACPAFVRVTVTNADCEPQRFVVDGQVVAPYLVQGADATFDTNPGYHRIHACNIDTGDCSEDVLVIWTDSTATMIMPSGKAICQ